MRGVLAGVVLILSAALLFARLGHNPLWDDEAATALHGQAVWKTGDTGAILDHNIVAYNGGEPLYGLKERSTPPLQSYLVAPFVGLLGNHAWAARLPFAAIGLCTVVLLLYWLYSIDAAPTTWLLFAIAILCNVSLWLFMRQCRYYGPAILGSVAVAYLYLNWNGGRTQLVLLSIASILLLASNYLSFLALYVCMFVDYVIIGHKRKLLRFKDWLIVMLPQVVIGGIIIYIWNTLGTDIGKKLLHNSPSQRLMLIWLNLRDINRCQFGAGLLMLSSPLVYFWRRDPWLIRAPLILLVYVGFFSLISPQLMDPWPAYADVRYLAPVIPLCLAIGVLVLNHVARGFSPVLAVVIAFAAFGSNLFNGVPLPNVSAPLVSAPILYVRELIHPPEEPFTPTIEWIRTHVPTGASIWVVPGYKAYPLMFLAPQFIFAWQLKDPPPPAFKAFDLIHIHGRTFPDYVVAFGPFVQVVQDLHLPAGFEYRHVQTINTFWAEPYRPELTWHIFTQVLPSPDPLRIYIFKLQSAL